MISPLDLLHRAIILTLGTTLLTTGYSFSIANCIREKNRLEFDSMDKIFQKIIDNNFSDLKGMMINASIPVPQFLINEIIQAALQGNTNIESCQVSIHGQNRMDVHLKTTLLPWSFNLKLKLDHAVDFTSFSSPKIRAWLENNILLGRLGSFFNALPHGVKLYGNQVVIDITSFLQTPEQKRMLDLVKSVDIRTEKSQVILDAKIEVE